MKVAEDVQKTAFMFQNCKHLLSVPQSVSDMRVGERKYSRAQPRVFTDILLQIQHEFNIKQRKCNRIY
jgi:hypothetical protein